MWAMTVLKTASMNAVVMHYHKSDRCVSGRSLGTRKTTVSEVKDESDVSKVSTFEEVAVPLVDPVVR